MANPFFNAVYYLTQNRDVFAAGYTVDTAYDHYVQYGADEAFVAGGLVRAPNPWFDVKYYLTQNADLIAGGVTPETALDHFLTYGASEGRFPDAAVAANPITEAGLLAYAKANPDLLTAFGIEEDAAELTKAQQDQLTLQFYSYGYNESRPDAPTVVAQPDDQGDTFTLTTGADTATASYFDGSAPLGADVRQQTLNNSDSLTGAGDNATLYAELTGGTVTPLSLKDITNVDVELGFAGTPSGLNAINADAIKNVSVSNNGSAFTLNNLSTALSSLSLTNSTSGVTLGNLTGVTAGEDALAVSLSQVTGGTLNLGTAYATADITSTGAVNNELTNLAGTGLRTLNVTGDQNLNLGNALPNALTTVNAAEFTKNLTLATGNGVMDIVGGSGDDSVDFADTLTNDDKYDGGDGRDTLVTSSLTNTGLGVGNGISNVEILHVGGTATAGVAASYTVDSDVTTSFDAFIHNSTAAMTYTNTVGANMADSTKGLTVHNTGAVNLNIKGAGGLGASSDALYVSIGNTTGTVAAGTNTALQTAAGAATGTLTVADTETITLDVKASADLQTATGTGVVTATTLTNLNITGGAVGEAFNVGNTGNTTNAGGGAAGIVNAGNGLVKIDGSSFVGNLTVHGTAVGQVINGGSGNDFLGTGGSAAFGAAVAKDVLTGGEGTDIFSFRGNDATLTGADLTVMDALASNKFIGMASITDLNLGGSTAASVVDQIDLSMVGGVDVAATLGFDTNTVTVVNGGAATALSGVNLGTAVNALVNGGILGATADATGVAAGLFTWGSDTFLIASQQAVVADDFGTVAGSDIIIKVTGVTGTLDASDFTAFNTLTA